MFNYAANFVYMLHALLQICKYVNKHKASSCSKNQDEALSPYVLWINFSLCWLVMTTTVF